MDRRPAFSASVAVSASLALTLMVVQLAFVRMASDDLPVRVVLPLTVALAPLALWAHRQRIGAWVIVVGLCANLAAMLANGGLMPIERATVESAVGVERAAEYETGAWIAGSKDVLVEDGRLTALGDAVIVRVGDGGFAASPGDVVIVAGVLFLVGEAAYGALASERPRALPEDAEPAPPFAA